MVALVLTRYTTLFLLAIGLLLSSACASVQLKALPEYAYLGTYAASIAAQEGSLQNEESLVNEMAEGVGWWVAFSSVETLIQQRIDRPLTWWERLAIWALPIVLNVKRIFEDDR